MTTETSCAAAKCPPEGGRFSVRTMSPADDASAAQHGLTAYFSLSAKNFRAAACSSSALGCRTC
jgi:hypothetical protein